MSNLCINTYKKHIVVVGKSLSAFFI